MDDPPLLLSFSVALNTSHNATLDLILMLFSQAVHGLPRALVSGTVPLTISFSKVSGSSYNMTKESEFP